MLFFSLKFILFFIVVFFLYWSISRPVYRKLVLLITSYIFYAAWDYRFLGLIFFSTALDYTVGIMLARVNQVKQRKWLLFVSVFGNLGVLFAFKYFDFFTASFIQLLSFFSIEADPLYLNVILPLGISFYTFQTMSYTIDVYRRKIQPEKSVLNLAVFIAFFPQLTAGPIVRASVFLPQLALKRRLQDVPWKGAVALFALGLFKKVVVADNCAPFVDAVFADPTQYDAYSVVVAVFLFSIQMYCDFSGYSDMAIALAKLLGFNFPINFAWPFFARNSAVLWSRWHISLSSWFRDYVYSPLIGTKRSRLRADVSLMVTFLLSGLWHGAGWNFILFGIMQGGAILLFRFYKSIKKRLKISRNNPNSILVVLSIAITYLWFCFSGLFFRAQDLNTGIDMATILLTLSSQGAESLPSFALVIWAVFFMFHWLSWKVDLIKIADNMRPSLYGLVLGVYFAIIIAATPSNDAPFVYFQF
jgi:alginate O-acetyltransferase complex protein AlgI